MNVKLNIEEDQELRNYIKQLVKNQVVSVVREEIHSIVYNTINEKLTQLTGDFIQKTMANYVKDAINNSTQRVEVGGWDVTKKTIIIAAEEEAKQIVREQLKDIKNVISEAIKKCI